MIRSLLLSSSLVLVACAPKAPDASVTAPEPPVATASTGITSPVLACDATSSLKPDVTKESLVATYGAANVTEETVPWVDSEEKAVVLFASDPDTRIELLWLDKTTGGPRVIQTAGKTWTGPLGLHTGASMADVEAANGAPVSLMGFSNHNAGEANDFHNGKLAADAPGCRTTLIFDTPDDLPPEVATPVNNSPDKVYASDSPEMKAAKPFLAAIVLSYPDPS